MRLAAVLFNPASALSREMPAQIAMTRNASNLS